MFWTVAASPSRLACRLTLGHSGTTLCYASLHPDAPLWLLVLAATVEYFHPAHLAWSTDR